MIINLVRINRIIESVRVEHIKNLSKNTKEYKIAIHSNRIISHLVINSLIQNQNVQEELITTITDDQIKASYLKYIQKNYKLYQSSEWYSHT